MGPKFKIGQWVFWTQVLVSGKQNHTVGKIATINWADGQFKYGVTPWVNRAGKVLSGASRYSLPENMLNAVPESVVPQYEILIQGK